MKYEADGFYVRCKDKRRPFAVGCAHVDAKRVAAELNRLAEERDALLEACKAIDQELRLLAAQGRAREKPSLDVIGQLRAAIAKAEGGAA